MRNKYHIIFNLFLSFFALISVQTQVQAQETQKLAPNNIPVPWYSQKITGCPYSHCSLASSLMVFDYFKGMTTDTQRTAQDAEKKLIEYQRNYFLKKRAPFRRRTSIGQGGYYSFEIDSLTRYYENMISAEHFQQKDYRVLKDYIDRGIPVLVNVRYTGSVRGMRPAKIYNGLDSAVEGILLVGGSGEVLCYHKSEKQVMEDFLFQNTRLEKGSLEKDKYGFLERENGVYYFKLNAKIGLVKR